LVLQDLLGALATLEPMELTPETRAHWAQLAEAALDQEALAVAERCYAAMGDVAKARYLHKVCNKFLLRHKLCVQSILQHAAALATSPAGLCHAGKDACDSATLTAVVLLQCYLLTE
jgi:hypothetical protein